MSGSTGYNFVAGTKARASEVNLNFEWMRGHYLPITQSNTWLNTTGVYDLGSSAARWRTIYLADTSTAINGATGAITPAMLSGSVAGQRLFSTVLTVATTTVTISGLNGDAAGIFRLLLKLPPTGGNPTYLVYNGVTTTSYHSIIQAHSLDTSTQTFIQSAGGSSVLLADSFGYDFMLECSLFVSTGRSRLIMGRGTEDNNVYRMHILNGRWSNTTATITSITIYTPAAAALAIGTTIELYRVN